METNPTSELAALEGLVPETVIRFVATALRPGDVVAFDADGTLWGLDVGEALLAALDETRTLPGFPNGGAYQEYERRLGASLDDAFGFAAAVMGGLARVDVEARAAAIARHQVAPKLFPWAPRMLAAVRAVGAECWVVSASPRIAVVPGAALLGIPAERVVGVETEGDGDLLSSRLLRPLPCDGGKVEVLRARGLKPALAFGDSRFDRPMLEMATLGVAVAPTGTDTPLAAWAASRGRPVVRT